jgi:fibronectin type III domain protein
MALGDQQMKHARRVLGGAACAATVAGLLLPMEAAVAEVGPCPGTAVGSTFALSDNCVLTQTWQVDANGTIDGNGHTITLAAGFTGTAAIESASGANGAPAPSLTVKHLNLEVGGASTGILFSGATGGVHQVTITGSSGMDTGVDVDNTVGADFGTGLVKIDSDTVISGYRVAGVHVQGNAKFGVLRAKIGAPAAGSGPIVSGIWAENGAHGSVKESTIDLSAQNPAGPTSYGVGVRIVGDPASKRRIEVKRNVFTGGDADFGVSVENPGTTWKVTAAVDCNLFRRADSRTTGDAYGLGVAQWTSGRVNAQVTDSTFEGNWNRATGDITSSGIATGPVNTTRSSSSTCVPNAPTHVAAMGGDRQSKVTWHAPAEQAWAPLVGYTVKAKAVGHPAVSKTVSATATSAVLKGLKNGLNYTVTVTAGSNGGTALATGHLYATKVSLKAKPGRIHRGHATELRGKLTSMDRKAHLKKRHVAIWAKAKGGKWRLVSTVRTKADGSFALKVKPHKLTTYRAFYAGRPDLASGHKTKVVVRR